MTQSAEPPAAAESPPPLYPNTPDMAHLNWPDPGLIGTVRLALRIVWMLLALILCVPLYYVWRLFGLSNPWPRLFLKWVGRACGARVTMVGTPLRRDVFFIANHLSWLDIPIIGGCNGSAFVSQDGIRDWPIVGWLCKLNNTVFISRSDRMGIANQINQLREALEQTWAITIFPEGTTTDGKSMLPFKAPLLKVLEPPPPGVLVQPVYIDYQQAAWEIAWVGEETAPGNAWRLLTRKGSFEVILHFLEPFNPAEMAGRKAIASEARSRIEAALYASMDSAALV